MKDSTLPPLEVSVQHVRTLQSNKTDFLLLDCREREEFETARIEGSLLIPMTELARRTSELEPYRNRNIVVHCHHGGRSMRVTQWLREQGYGHAQNMAGGIDAWSQEIDPTVPRY